MNYLKNYKINKKHTLNKMIIPPQQKRHIPLQKDTLFIMIRMMSVTLHYELVSDTPSSHLHHFTYNTINDRLSAKN